MGRTPSEIKSLVTEVEQPFISAPRSMGAQTSSSLALGLRERMRLTENIVFTRDDYRARLSPLLSQQASVGPALLRHYKDMVISGLRSEIRNHLTPDSELIGAAEDADALEAFEAFAMLRLDPSGYVRDSAHYYQTVGYFFAAILELDDYEPPMQAHGEGTADYTARKEHHRARWFPFHISVKNPESVAFAETSRTTTLAVCRYRLPLVDLMERYGAGYDVKRDDPDRMAKIYGEHFSFLRADEPGKVEGSLDMWRKEYEVCWVSDGVTNSHYVNLQGVRGSNKAFHPLGEGDFPNPFGQVPLMLCEGVYNPGQPIAYRREPLIMPLIQIEDARALMKSHWFSESLSPPWLYEQMPAEARADDAPPGVEFVVDSVTGRPRIARAWGELKTVEHKVDETRDKLYGIFEHEAGIASPMSLLEYDDAKASQVAVSNVLTQIDEWKSRLGGAAKSEINMWSRALDMIEYALSNKLNGHRTKGDAKASLDWPYSFVVTGNERVKGKAITSGKSYEITPQILDREYTRTLEPVDTRLSTRAAMQGEADKRWAAGTLLYDEWLEMHGVENVTEFKRKKKAEILYQLEAPRQIMATRQAMAQLEALRSGKSPEDVLMQTDVNPDFGNQLAALPPQPTSGITRMGSPALEGMGTGVGAESVA